MPGRLPILEDFSPQTIVSITPPPLKDQQPINCVVLLHGLGDSIASFSSLGVQLALPETTVVTVQGPFPLPFDLGGFHWGDDLMLQSNGEIDFDAGFKESSKLLVEDVLHPLLRKCNYEPRNIFLFGLGQGGMVAL